ncbi:unnamed protein product [Echinostoma caproni]|uniref:Hyphal_reg_CWP domain-containing protein n=1 Tax=Echinostoma caproni TaxID=27848 RepID=A0A183AZ73_9TREM|nr:unnamed protein product [Echinostoma caproni]
MSLTLSEFLNSYLLLLLPPPIAIGSAPDQLVHQQVLVAANYSGSTLLKAATCNVLQFTKGSVWADAQLTTQTPASEVPTGDQIAQLLLSGSQNYQDSFGSYTGYAFEDASLQVQSQSVSGSTTTLGTGSQIQTTITTEQPHTTSTQTNASPPTSIQTTENTQTTTTHIDTTNTNANTPEHTIASTYSTPAISSTQQSAASAYTTARTSTAAFSVQSTHTSSQAQTNTGTNIPSTTTPITSNWASTITSSPTISTLEPRSTITPSYASPTSSEYQSETSWTNAVQTEITTNTGTIASGRSNSNRAICVLGTFRFLFNPGSLLFGSFCHVFYALVYGFPFWPL